MNIEKSSLTDEFRKQRVAVFIIIVLLTSLFFVVIYRLPVMPGAVAPVVVNLAQVVPFRLYSDTAGLHPNDSAVSIPARFSGIVTDAWRADNVANRHACLSRWLFDRAHESLCARLSAHRILAIQVESAAPLLTAFVPAPLAERVVVGDRVRVLRGALSADGSVVTMPMLVEVIPKMDSETGKLTSR